uniref:Uncharacterized protein n=1 Tax=Schistosoma haematobium TaxID=6185 RepID=A0A094ZLB7_SCHHA
MTLNIIVIWIVNWNNSRNIKLHKTTRSYWILALKARAVCVNYQLSRMQELCCFPTDIIQCKERFIQIEQHKEYKNSIQLQPAYALLLKLPWLKHFPRI